MPDAPLDPTAFVHPLAFVSGAVTLGAESSVWPFAVIRGDTERIIVGARCNVQDGAVLHADPGFPTTLEAGASVGHRAIVHGATVGAGALVGMGAVLLNGVRVGAGAIVAAGALCPEGMEVPPAMLAVGVPARVVRAVTDAERARTGRTSETYAALARRHRAGEFPALGAPATDVPR